MKRDEFFIVDTFLHLLRGVPAGLMIGESDHWIFPATIQIEGEQIDEMIHSK